MEQFANAAVSTLNGAITSGSTSLVVANASAFPTSGNFRIGVESEIMLVTARSSNTLTITRGQEGTVAAAHNNGVIVAHIVTAGAISQAKSDAVATVIPGVISVTAPPLAATWTLVNAGGATIVNGTRSNVIFSAASAGSTSNNRRLAWSNLSYPATPFTYTVGMYVQAFATSNVLAGITVGDSGANFIEFTLVFASGVLIELSKWSSPTTSTGTYQQFNSYPLSPSQFLYFHMHDDGTNLTWAFSLDGIFSNGVIIDQRARTDFLTPAKLGLVIDPFNTDSLRGNVYANVVHLQAA